MKITVTTVMTDRFFLLDVAEELALENFKVCCEIDSGISSVEMLVFHHGQPLLDDARTLRDYGIRDGDCVSVTGAGTTLFEGQGLSDVLTLSTDTLAFHLDNENSSRELDIFKTQQLPKLESEAQGLNVTEVDQPNIQNNMSDAKDITPEICGTGTMLCVNCRVNGVALKGLVDSGAPKTLISTACAERCSMGRLIDYSWRGSAQGHIGTSRTVGRIHIGQLQIEHDFLTTSFTVVEEGGQPLDLLLGLDLLKRHQCLLDLQRNVLRIGTTGTETAFVLASGEQQPQAMLSSVGKPVITEQKDQNAGDGASLMKGPH